MKLSQLRKDVVSGDWIVVAPKRSKRPHTFQKKSLRKRSSRTGCIFENPPESAGLKESILEVKNKHGWSHIVIQNLYPAFIRKNISPAVHRRGPYTVVDGIGYHEILITRDHHNDFPALSTKEAQTVFAVFKDRYVALAQDPSVAYVALFHNWGPLAGASIYHPHYQMVGIPIVPPDFEHSLVGSTRFYRKEKKCVHCAMIAFEKKEKKRIIFENKNAIAFTPFISRTSFEIRVFPKSHQSYFEDTKEEVIADVVEALQVSLGAARQYLGDPDYNFFIHTAPTKDKQRFKSYHWHIEVIPKISIQAGFELGTGIDIIAVDPDHAAKILRGKK